MNVLTSELIPDELPDERREQWETALRILDGVLGEEGFVKAVLAGYSGMQLWEMHVTHQGGETTVEPPSPGASGSVTNSWFACLLEVQIEHIGLQALIEWMESWEGYQQVFFPALLVEGRTARSHRVGDRETITFVWE